VAARSSWKGVVSFGMVSIPVKLYSAIQDMEAIQAKLQGEDVVEAPPAAAPSMTDLMSAPKASVEAASKRPAAADAPKKATARKAAGGGASNTGAPVQAPTTTADAAHAAPRKRKRAA
jgi:non-homologous end joining protein Ku